MPDKSDTTQIPRSRNSAVAFMVSVIALWVPLGASAKVSATQRYGALSSAEMWAWSRIRKGEVADFDRRCGCLHPGSQIVGHANTCRDISSDFLVTVLTSKQWLDHIPFEGLEVTGAHITGDLVLENAKLARPVLIRHSQFDGQINLTQATTDSVLALENSTIFGNFNAESLYSDRNVDLSGTRFMHGVRLDGATINGDLKFVGATLNGNLEADHLQIRDSLWLGGGYRPYQPPPTTFNKRVNLGGAKIGRDLYLERASFHGQLYADSLEVRDLLGFNSQFEDVDLGGAKIGQNLYVNGATFDGLVNAIYLSVDGNVDVSGATVPYLDLAGAWIGGELRLARKGKVVKWQGPNGKPGTLSLRNAHVGALVDSTLAWPSRGHLHLDGFSLDKLGGAEEDASRYRRSANWWDRNWAQLDDTYSPAPYAQLVKVFTASGNHRTADDIRFLGWKRQRVTQHGWPWLWSVIFQYVVGFGVGLYVFRVVYIVFIITLALGFYLRMRVPQAGNNGLLWCIGAGFDRLFPVLQFNKAFRDFFDNPQPNGLTPGQDFAFSAMRIVGLTLGAFLAAAVTGLAQGQ